MMTRMDVVWSALADKPTTAGIVFIVSRAAEAGTQTIYCMPAAAKILLPQHILPGGKKKLQVYCQRSVVRKHSLYKKGNYHTVSFFHSEDLGNRSEVWSPLVFSKYCPVR